MKSSSSALRLTWSNSYDHVGLREGEGRGEGGEEERDVKGGGGEIIIYITYSLV